MVLLLPAGPLREGIWRMNTADLVIFNGGENHVKYQTANLQMHLAATEVYHIKSGKKLTITNFLSQYPTINAIAGIGDPQRFFNTLMSLQFTIDKQHAFVDHHHFTLEDFSQFPDNIVLLMTEKDAVKCRDFAQDHWWYLPVNAKFSIQEQQLLQTKVHSIMSNLAHKE